jgi:uridine phosphorylase
MTSVRTAEFPVDSEGRVHHVGVKAGDVANRVITVGDPARAYKLAQYLDEPKEKLLIVSSSRGFLTITGHFNKVPVSIVAIGMVSSELNLTGKNFKLIFY